MEATLLVVVVLLGHPSYKVRDKAQGVLQKVDFLALDALRAGELSNDPEIVFRSRKVIACWLFKTAPKIVKSYEIKGKLPHIAWECYDPLTYPGKWGYMRQDLNPYLEGLRSEKFIDNAPDWPMWREACRRWLIDLVRARVDIDKIVRCLWDAERRWVKNKGYYK